MLQNIGLYKFLYELIIEPNDCLEIINKEGFIGTNSEQKIEIIFQPNEKVNKKIKAWL